MAESPLYVFPSGPFDDPGAARALLGSFWTDTYAGGTDPVVAALTAARLQLAAGADRDLQALVDACSRLTCPTLHVEQWYELRLRESDRGGSLGGPRFGDAGLVFAADSAIRYGTPYTVTPAAWLLPAGVVDVPLLFNRISDSSRMLVRGVDFTLTEGHLVFRDDPFADDLIAKTDVLVGNERVDRELVLWAFRARVDQQTVYRQFGYAIEVPPPPASGSASAYRDLVNAVYDALLHGTTADHLQRVWSAATGVPLAGTDGETVESVLDEGDRGKVVVTDLAAYRFMAAAEVTVVAGDVLRRGGPMTDALVIEEFNRGQPLDAGDVPALALGRGMLAAGFFGDLVFENKEVPLVVTYDTDGYARVAFEIGGWPGDIERFFDEMHTRGRDSGQTLAHLLDSRPAAAKAATPEPPAGSLPAVINPLAFLCANVLRNHVVLVRLRPAACSPDGTGLTSARAAMRAIVPPQTVVLVAVTLDYADDPIRMDVAGGADAFGASEPRVAPFLAQTISETLGPTDLYRRERVRAFRVGGRCI